MHALLAVRQPIQMEPNGYEPGVCNIGPAEIARRRRTGNFGAIATVALFALLVWLDVPPLARFLVALPAALAAGGYLQAALKFCVAFGVAGVFNFGSRGETHSIADKEARARDRAKVVQMMAVISAIAITVGLLAVVVPL
jgi:hypothetical protein